MFASIQVIGVNGDRPSPSKRLVEGKAGVFEPSPVKKINESVGPAPPHHDGMESIVIRSLSSGGIIAEKEGTLMNLRPGADSSWRACPYYHELTRSVERGGSAPPLDFDGTRQRLESRFAFALDGSGIFFCPRWVRWLGFPPASERRISGHPRTLLSEAISMLSEAISIALLTRVFHPTLVYLLRRPLGLTDERRSPTIASNKG